MSFTFQTLETAESAFNIQELAVKIFSLHMQMMTVYRGTKHLNASKPIQNQVELPPPSYHSPVYDEVVMEILQTSEQLKNYTFDLNKTSIN